MGEPNYENVTSSVFGGLGLNIPEVWSVKSYFTLMLGGFLYAPISGNYSFQLESVGSSKFYLDGKLFLNKENATDHGVTWLERGFHSIEVEYVRENSEIPFVQLLWQPPWESNEVEIKSEFLYQRISPDVASPFLTINWVSGSRSPFPLINKDHYTTFANFSLYAPTSGTYKYKVVTDGYTSLSIDGNLVLSAFKDANQTVAEIFLSEGSHIFQIDYMKLQENAYLNVLWQTPTSSQFEELPSSNLHWRLS